MKNIFLCCRYYIGMYIFLCGLGISPMPLGNCPRTGRNLFDGHSCYFLERHFRIPFVYSKAGLNKTYYLKVN